MKISEALLATLATPPLFSPVVICKGVTRLEFSSGDLIAGNPARETVKEAHEAFGGDGHVGCFLSIGSGHPGVTKAPSANNASLESWNCFLERVLTGSEQMAQTMDEQMGRLGIFYRFSVTRGLERTAGIVGPDPGETLAQTNVYLTEASALMDRCVDSLRTRDGIVRLEQLSEPHR